MKIGDLQQKMQARLEDDQKATEQAVQASLNDLTQNLQKSMQSAVNTIEGDIINLRKNTRLLTKSSLKAYFFHLICSMMLIVGIVLMGKGTSFYMIHKINNLQSEIETLEQEHSMRLKTVNTLETWGIQTMTDKTGDFLILPQDMKIKTGWTIKSKNGKQEAIKLEKK